MTTSPQTKNDGNNIPETHQSRLDKLQAWKNKGINPYETTQYNVDSFTADLQTKYADIADGEETGDEVHVAGRIMSNRNSGMFIDLQDHTGRIQIFSHKKHLDEEALEQLKLLDIGDIIGVHGLVRRTPRGELTINTLDFLLLSKSLQPLPEKFHGLSDVETKYRKRHIDITMSEQSRETFKKRSKIISSIRRTVEDQGFMEVETPMFHPILGGASAKPFETHHNALDVPLYMRVAPELYLKKLIISGVSDKVYEMGKNFRNEGISVKHNPEFTSIETYQAYANVDSAIALAEDIIVNACKAANDGKTKITFEDKEIDFSSPWPRKSMLDMIKENAGIDFRAIEDDAEARAACKKAGIHVDDDYGWGKCVEAAFEEKVEETLIQPTHIIDYPKEISPLAKSNPEDPRLTERFESFANGWEIANGFSELNDPFDQYERFKEQVAAGQAGDEEAQQMDDTYIEALEFALPPTAGLGVGVDRVIMLLTNSSSIRDVILFPTLRPSKADSLIETLDTNKN